MIKGTGARGKCLWTHGTWWQVAKKEIKDFLVLEIADGTEEVSRIEKREQNWE